MNKSLNISCIHVSSYGNRDFKCMYLGNQIINLECVRYADLSQFQSLHVANALLLSENQKHIHTHEPTIYRINLNKRPGSVAF